ncbi:MAG: ABC transporter permease [Zoogloeaceae bacterium]|nr:ABC transporter permease [Rhodocyclaceae bacterium]MCP5236256.1 ABC transporter permease [Zoogloeaceae bacterium]
MTAHVSHSAPAVSVNQGVVVLQGEWTLRALTPELRRMRRLLDQARDIASWDLAAVSRLDNFGAQLLWRHWQRSRPGRLVAAPELLRVIDAVEALGDARLPATPRHWLAPIHALGDPLLALFAHIAELMRLVGQIAIDLAYLGARPQLWPIKEFSANLFKTGVRAMPVTALVGFLIGVVLSYLSALQLKAFGADIFIVNILGLGIIRELGPVLVSVLVAGRSGSAMTAQLGVMRVTEEIDALATMGISRHVRLVLPKVMALAVAMPLLVLWASGVAILGGMVSARLQLGIGFGFFLQTLPTVVPIANLYIAIAKGAVFGVVIALVACHFGLRVKPNTESLSANTTASVVSAITAVILMDAVFAIATRHIGVPL